MLHDLDSEAALDPARVGAKAAWLGRARRARLPILPGLVVDSAASLEHMSLGAKILADRGSGGARLAMTAAPPPLADELVARAGQLGEVLVARSSTGLEASGEWSGAFTSYLEVSPAELPRAVTGCWASAFSVAALERQSATGVDPGSVSMAVLVQPAIEPEAGGTARLETDGTVVVNGVKGSPAPLLQGWASGHSGPELVEVMGVEAIERVEAILREAHEATGANRCEWALLDGEVWVLQLGQAVPREPPRRIDPGPIDPRLTRIARIVIGYGEEAWERYLVEMGVGHSIDKVLLGPDPGPALDAIDRMTRTARRRAGELLEPAGQPDIEHQGRRRGVGRWEPLVASVVLGTGDRVQGTPASAGMGAGVSTRPGDFRVPLPSRSVLAAGQPVPNLAPLLWDAAAIVTETGSPAAHLFESARALRVPAVCGVTIPPGDLIVAVDGQDGVVATISLHGEDDV